MDDRLTRLPGPGDSTPLDLQVRAAWLYYVEGLTQEETARAMRLSRAKIVRLLAAARDDGVVRIQIGAKAGEHIGLERRLVDRFALDQALVIPTPSAGHDLDAALGRAAGSWLVEQVHDGMSIGIGWGATLSMTASALPARSGKQLSVISLLGGMTHSRGVNPSAVARRIADALGAECYQLTAPLVVADEAMRDALWAEPGLAELCRRARRVDLALVSVGDVSEEATLFRSGMLPRQHLDTLLGAGAVGDVLGQFIDAQGRVVDHPLGGRVIAVDLAELRRLPRVAIVSGGQRKVAALRAALAATGARVLITDDGAARGLLAD